MSRAMAMTARCRTTSLRVCHNGCDVSTELLSRVGLRPHMYDPEAVSFELGCFSNGKRMVQRVMEPQAAQNCYTVAVANVRHRSPRFLHGSPKVA